jgi:hypothetical protein
MGDDIIYDTVININWSKSATYPFLTSGPIKIYGLFMNIVSAGEIVLTSGKLDPIGVPSLNNFFVGSIVGVILTPTICGEVRTLHVKSLHTGFNHNFCEGVPLLRSCKFIYI